MTLKKRAVDAIIGILRAYIRYSPIGVGKAALYGNVIAPYLEWRQHASIVRTVGGFRMETRLPDQIQSRIYFFGVWEPQLTAYIKERLSPGDTFIDIGANVGYYTLLAASIVGKRGRVCAIEASPSIYSTLEKNIALNGYTNVAAFNEAAADKEGILEIFRAPDNNIGATTTVAAQALQQGHVLEAQVRARTLDAIVGRETLAAARLIKMDVEGAEMSVIRGIRDLFPLFSDRAEWVFEVTPKFLAMQGNVVSELLDCFMRAGYKLYQISNSYEDDDYFKSATTCELSELRDIPTKQVDLVASKTLGARK